MKTTVNIFRTLLLAVLTLTFGACGEDSLLSELGLDGQTATKAEEAGVWQGDIAESFAGGSGTAEAPYLIANGAQLKRFAAIVNGTDNMEQNTAICGKLTADIVLNDTKDWESWETTAPTNSWTPIGSYEQQFIGILDGDGHSVIGIYINNSEADYQGLVGFLGESGTLQNLGVEASYIKGNKWVGGLCGENFHGTVSNCYNSATIIGYEDIGGVCGRNNNGELTNCYNTGKIEGSKSYVGGVCGYNVSSTMTNCYNTGSVAGTGDYYTGGVCGYNWGTVSNCYNSGSVTSTGSYTGGVCGRNMMSTVTNSYNSGNVTGTGDYTGGVCGYNDQGTVTNCYNTGSIADGSYAGGVCGKTWSATVTNCYYLTGKANSGIGSGRGEATAKTAEQFQSGEVAWLLQNGQTEQVWGQNISFDPKDSYPVLGGLKVVQNGDGYKNELSQDGDFYLISTADELRLFASMVNGGQTTISAKLTADIELNNTTGWENWGSNAPANSWTPIGTNWENPFAGTFDGQGHTISGLYVNGSDYSIYYTGLFGGLEDGGTVENVGVTKSYIQSDNTGGIVASLNGGTIRNCYYTGIIRCQGGYSGGIAVIYGYNNITIENCYFAGRIISQYGYDEMIGPIVGGMHAEYVNPTNCYYLDTCGASGKGTSKTEAQFKSGEVASLLGEGWGQTIGTDDSPVLTTDASKKVYALDLYNGTPDKQQSYANIGTSFLPEGSNAIALVDADSPFKTGTNIVVKDGDSYTCDNLVLTDGADFYTPVAFTATNATYTRTPSVWATNDGSGSGWETICLPFSGTLYADEEAKQPILTDLAGDYWLRSLTDFKTPNTLIFASGSTATAADNQIKAGVPYIIALPGETFDGESLKGQTISVRGTNVTVINTARSLAAGSMFAFTGTFATKACEALSYRLNSENGTSGAGDLFVLDTELTDLAPFRCRIDVTGLNIGGASTRSASGLPKELRIGQ